MDAYRDIQEVEDVGDEIWNELALRSFFQEIRAERSDITFKMHDLVHDLAQSIMENKIPGAKANDNGASSSDIKIREVHWRIHFKTTSSSITVVVSTLTTIMKYNRLTTLKLNSPGVEELPSATGKLKHLRFLDLSQSSIRNLPRTFCCLCNLQILDLSHCSKLKSLPKNIRYMTTLRHIFLEECYSLSRMPYKIGELVSLKTLSLFIVDDSIGNRLDELEHLNLGRWLQIKHLENVQNHMSAKRANLVGKPNLSDLWLEWEGDNRSSELTKTVDDEKILEALEPHLNLTTLYIIGFKGHGLALWVKKMKNLTSISLFKCRNITHLPPLGNLPCRRVVAHLTALEELLIWACKEVVDIQFLKRLTLMYVRHMVSLPQGLQHIPSLQFLTLYGLERLTSLPDWLPNLVSLTPLVIEECPAISSLPSCIPEMRNLRCLEISRCPQLQMPCVEPNGEDCHNIAHIPRLSIQYPYYRQIHKYGAQDRRFLVIQPRGIVE